MNTKATPPTKVAHQRPLQPPPQKQQQQLQQAPAEACENCGRVIGRLETAHVYRDRVTCGPCWSWLRAADAAPRANGAERKVGLGLTSMPAGNGRPAPAT